MVANKSNHIETFEVHRFLTEFQFIQGHELLYHLVHFIRFIHNDAAVKFPAFRIVVDTLLQALRIALDKRNRGL